MKVKCANLLVNLVAGLCLGIWAPLAVAEIPTKPWQLAQNEPLPPLPFGNQGTPLDPNDFPSVVVPENTQLQVDPNWNGDQITEDSKLYLVYIPGENPQTLEQVRLYEPEAFFTEYKGRTVIQAGVFANRYNAERLAREMEFGGVRSAIDTLKQPRTTFATTPPTPPVTTTYNLPPINNSLANPPMGTSFPSSATPLPPSNVNLPNGYFVVIPGNRQELPRMIQEAIDAGIDPNSIFTREEPFGPHVAIGPFDDRTMAEQERGYLQKFGMDARIHVTD